MDSLPRMSRRSVEPNVINSSHFSDSQFFSKHSFSKYAFSKHSLSTHSFSVASLDAKALVHLPKAKREALQQVVNIILSRCQPAMLLLFGSYARGDWLQTPDYQSSFDIWLIVDKAPLVQKIARKNTLYNQLRREVETPVHLLVEDVQGIQRRLAKGQFLYVDRLQESWLLYESGGGGCRQQFATPPSLLYAQRKQQAEADFRYWFAKANVYWVYADLAMQQGDWNEAAFFLHQSVERFYATILWVFGRYQSSSHDLQQLHQLVTSIVPSLLLVFPQGLVERAMFEQLRQAYVKARYKPSFSIDSQTLEWLSRRVGLLKQLTKEVCQVRIASYHD